jgi:hypothetical protein
MGSMFLFETGGPTGMVRCHSTGREKFTLRGLSGYDGKRRPASLAPRLMPTGRFRCHAMGLQPGGLTGRQLSIATQPDGKKSCGGRLGTPEIAPPQRHLAAPDTSFSTRARATAPGLTIRACVEAAQAGWQDCGGRRVPLSFNGGALAAWCGSGQRQRRCRPLNAGAAASGTNLHVRTGPACSTGGQSRRWGQSMTDDRPTALWHRKWPRSPANRVKIAPSKPGLRGNFTFAASQTLWQRGPTRPGHPSNWPIRRSAPGGNNSRQLTPRGGVDRAGRCWPGQAFTTYPDPATARANVAQPGAPSRTNGLGGPGFQPEPGIARDGEHGNPAHDGQAGLAR